jgi:hypothetical protein
VDDNVEGDESDENEVHPFRELSFPELHGEEDADDRQNVRHISSVQ